MRLCGSPRSLPLSSFLFSLSIHPLLLGLFSFYLSNESCLSRNHTLFPFDLLFLCSSFPLPLSILPEGFWVTFLMVIVWPCSFFAIPCYRSLLSPPKVQSSLCLCAPSFLSSPLTPSLSELSPQRRPRYL